MELFVPFKDLPLSVTLAFPPSPTTKAVKIALLPLPFRPTMKLTFGFKLTSNASWHIKLRMKTRLTLPIVCWKKENYENIILL